MLEREFETFRFVVRIEYRCSPKEIRLFRHIGRYSISHVRSLVISIYASGVVISIYREEIHLALCRPIDNRSISPTASGIIDCRAFHQRSSHIVLHSIGIQLESIGLQIRLLHYQSTRRVIRLGSGIKDKGLPCVLLWCQHIIRSTACKEQCYGGQCYIFCFFHIVVYVMCLLNGK